jgi:hypothetical protein
MLHFWDWYLRKYTSRKDKNSRTESWGKFIGVRILFDEDPYTQSVPLNKISLASSKIHSRHRSFHQKLTTVWSGVLMFILFTVRDWPRKIFFFYFFLQQYATMDNSSLIPYCNTLSELKLGTFSEIMYY